MSAGPIFLSASVPNRNLGRYHLDVNAVRDAVRGLVAETVNFRPLVFGGHPAISPLIWDAASSLGADNMVYIYQSEKYRSFIPKEASYFKRLVWTPGVAGPKSSQSDPYDRDLSLELMRDWMIVQRKVESNMPALEPYDGAVFIGGMDGVEDEWKLFTDNYSGAVMLPVGSTKGACRVILNDPIRALSLKANVRKALISELNYRKLFRDHLP